ncbi:MAG: hypothetical protein JW951_03415 [Lentisphaerae bacterium]|nr:hypothetical protein [Lentisphaerota bacterium]
MALPDDASAVPADLRAETYFDFDAHPFAHRALLDDTPSVCAAIRGIGAYARSWLERAAAAAGAEARRHTDTAPGAGMVRGAFEVILEAGAVFAPALIIGAGSGETRPVLRVGRDARVIGAVLGLEAGGISIGAGSTIEAGAGLHGPVIIGCGTSVRQGAYLRENVILGNGVTVRGEIKNSVMMDGAAFPHPSYVGDSLCGYRSHFGNQATTANIGLFAGLFPREQRPTLHVACGGRTYDLGGAKMGVCLGDYCQVGCNSVTDPGTFLKPRTLVYPLCRVPKGFYGPDEILKYKPLAQGVIRRTPFRF